MGPLASLADVLVGNEEDLQLALGLAADGIDPAAGKVSTEAFRGLAERARSQFPNLEVLAITLRESRSADRNGWSAALLGRSGFHVSRRYELLDIVDRVGSGDAFAAGLVFGLLELGDEERALEFAVAASALKHTIPGDLNLVTRAEVDRLVAGDHSGRVSR
jgi:2-dehydro-3-deoxygluconokinase